MLAVGQQLCLAMFTVGVICCGGVVGVSSRALYCLAHSTYAILRTTTFTIAIINSSSSSSSSSNSKSGIMNIGD